VAAKEERNRLKLEKIAIAAEIEKIKNKAKEEVAKVLSQLKK
jgi:hypothetical protein